MIVTSKMCMTKDIGKNGNLFGGNMLAWMDEAAAIYAHQQTKESTMVTLKFGEILFKRPVKVGDIVDFYCHSSIIGNTHIEFSITVRIKEVIVFETTCVFVALDETGKPKIIGN